MRDCSRKPWKETGRGPMAMPGKYSVSLSTWVDGEVKELVGPVEFECVPMGMTDLTPEQRLASKEFQKKTADLQRVILASSSVLSDTLERVRYMKSAIERSPRLELDLRKKARELELKLQDLQEQLNGDPTKPSRQEPEVPGLFVAFAKRRWRTLGDFFRTNYDVRSAIRYRLWKDGRLFNFTASDSGS